MIVHASRFNKHHVFHLLYASTAAATEYNMRRAVISVLWLAQYYVQCRNDHVKTENKKSIAHLNLHDVLDDFLISFSLYVIISSGKLMGSEMTIPYHSVSFTE